MQSKTVSHCVCVWGEIKSSFLQPAAALFPRRGLVPGVHERHFQDLPRLSACTPTDPRMLRGNWSSSALIPSSQERKKKGKKEKPPRGPVCRRRNIRRVAEGNESPSLLLLLLQFGGSFKLVSKELFFPPHRKLRETR